MALLYIIAQQTGRVSYSTSPPAGLTRVPLFPNIFVHIFRNTLFLKLL